MTIFCPRCGEQNSDEVKDCETCALPLTEISAIVAGRGISRYWQRVIMTLLIFLSLPLVLLRIGERVDKDFYEYFAGFLLVLMLPGLPWIVSAIFNGVSKQNLKRKKENAKHAK